MVVVRFENGVDALLFGLAVQNVLSATKCLASTRFETE